MMMKSILCSAVIFCIVLSGNIGSAETSYGSSPQSTEYNTPKTYGEPGYDWKKEVYEFLERINVVLSSCSNDFQGANTGEAAIYDAMNTMVHRYRRRNFMAHLTRPLRVIRGWFSNRKVKHEEQEQRKERARLYMYMTGEEYDGNKQHKGKQRGNDYKKGGDDGYSKGGDDYEYSKGGDDYEYSKGGDDDKYSKGGDDYEYSKGGDDDKYSKGGDDYEYSKGGDDDKYSKGGDDVEYSKDGDDDEYSKGGNDVEYSKDGDDDKYSKGGDDDKYSKGGDDDKYSKGGDDDKYSKGGDDDKYSKGGDDDKYSKGGDDDEYSKGGSDDYEEEYDYEEEDEYAREEEVPEPEYDECDKNAPVCSRGKNGQVVCSKNPCVKQSGNGDSTPYKK